MKETDKSLFSSGKEVDISSEAKRIYVYSAKGQIEIMNPLTLIITNDGHRITYRTPHGTIEGVEMAYGWLCIRHVALDGNFEFSTQVRKEKKKEKELDIH